MLEILFKKQLENVGFGFCLFFLVIALCRCQSPEASVGKIKSSVRFEQCFKSTEGFDLTTLDVSVLNDSQLEISITRSNVKNFKFSFEVAEIHLRQGSNSDIYFQSFSSSDEYGSFHIGKKGVVLLWGHAEKSMEAIHCQKANKNIQTYPKLDDNSKAIELLKVNWKPSARLAKKREKTVGVNIVVSTEDHSKLENLSKPWIMKTMHFASVYFERQVKGMTLQYEFKSETQCPDGANGESCYKTFSDENSINQVIDRIGVKNEIKLDEFFILFRVNTQTSTSLFFHTIGDWGMFPQILLLRYEESKLVHDASYYLVLHEIGHTFGLFDLSKTYGLMNSTDEILAMSEGQKKVCYVHYRCRQNLISQGVKMTYEKNKKNIVIIRGTEIDANEFFEKTIMKSDHLDFEFYAPTENFVWPLCSDYKNYMADYESIKSNPTNSEISSIGNSNVNNESQTPQAPVSILGAARDPIVGSSIVRSQVKENEKEINAKADGASPSSENKIKVDTNASTDVAKTTFDKKYDAISNIESPHSEILTEPVQNGAKTFNNKNSKTECHRKKKKATVF